jgi:predicted lipoprotein with Yx(FWY)xxD motif
LIYFKQFLFIIVINSDIQIFSHLKFITMKKLQLLTMFILLIGSGIVLIKCGKIEPQKVSPVVPSTSLAIKLATSPTLGNIITDKDGNTLYFFANDANGANNCTGGCTALWPNFNVNNLLVSELAPGLALADFASITTPSGSQLTYKGWPLYYYAPGGVRETPGQITGDGVGSVWFAAKPDYTIMIVKEQIVGIDLKNYVVDASNVYSEGTGKTTYFTDLAGRTLYSFFKDSVNRNKYTKADFSNNPVWPIYETDKIVIPSILDKTLFGSIKVFGKNQLTYKGWPLYYYGPDVDGTGKSRGYNKGVYGPLPVKWPVLFKNIPPAPMP